MQTIISSAARKRLALVAFTSLWLGACGGGGGGGDVTAAAPSAPSAPSASGNPGVSPTAAPVATGPAAPAAPASAPVASAPPASGTPAPAPASPPPPEWIGTVAVGTMGSGQAGPSLARLANGQTAVAWPTVEAGTQQIKVQRYDDAGAVVGPPVRIDSPSEPTILFPNDDAQTASVAATPTGYVVSWCSYRDRSGGVSGRPLPGWDAFMRRFDATGTALGAVIQVNTEPTNNCLQVSVVPLPDDKLGVAYRSYVYPFFPGPIAGSCLVRTFDGAGNGSVATDLGNAATCTAAPLPDGGFAVVHDFPTYGPNHVYLRRFDDRGFPIGDQVLVDGGGTPLASAVNADQPDIATLPDGNLAIAWVSNGAVVAQKFTPSGVPVAGRFQIVASGGSPKIAGLSDGAIALTWAQFPADSRELWSQSFFPTGATRDQAMRLTSLARAAVPNPGSGTAASSNGHSIVGWEEPASSGGFNVFIARR